MIHPDLYEFLESGVSVLVGTRSDRLFPDCCRGFGAMVGEDGREVTVYLPDATCGESLANLRDNGAIAVCFSRAIDHRSLQIKGEAVEIREADEKDRKRILRYRRALAESLGVVGVPPQVTLRIAHWPCRAVRVRVNAVFDQTPGPGAGAALGAPAR